MRNGLLGVSVAVVSALGLSTAAVDKARAYVMRNPEGAYAPLAMQLMIELGSRRAVLSGDRIALRRLLSDDLVYRPQDPVGIRKIYEHDGGRNDGPSYSSPSDSDSSADEGATFEKGKGWWDRRPRIAGAAAAPEAAQYLEIRSLRFRSEIESCRRPPPMKLYLECMANAVDTYARWVEEMPRTQNSVAPVAAPALREAARKIRQADDIPTARAAVAQAAGEIRKSIELVQAGGEDVVRRLELSQRSVILTSMAVLDDNLVQAIGI